MDAPRARSILSALVAAVGILVLAPVGAARAQATPVDLAGTWYVLVHYRDEATANPQAKRWEDKIWTFERRGSRLHWTEYPIVVFHDENGRFENLGTSRARRILHAWEPNPVFAVSELDEPRAVEPVRVGAAPLVRGPDGRDGQLHHLVRDGHRRRLGIG